MRSGRVSENPESQTKKSRAAVSTWGKYRILLAAGSADQREARSARRINVT
ncbi:hypothetical protein DEU37_2461 [Microbacterium sp. AG790]|nr:hypothetical protein DEU37_2461 [Microbacterium sp. AG790]